MLHVSRLSRRTFLGALAALTPTLAGADQSDGLQPSDALAVSPLDDWGWVETTGGRYLVGELIIRNRTNEPRSLIELGIGDRAGRSTSIQLSGADLQSRLANPATNLAVETRTLAAGDAALLYLWERVSTTTAIGLASMNVAATASGGDRKTTSVPLKSPLLDPIAVHPPLAGGPWVALYDPNMARGHRRVAFARGTRLAVPARYAIDWVRLDEIGRPASGAADDFGQWYGFGVDVLAVADGKVVAARDSYPDVLTRVRPAKWTEDDVSGNHVGLELASGRFAFYEHLQRGSVRVKVGDQVRAGQPIARLGRSGVNSSGPHLHLHVGSDPSTLDSQGRPWSISQFTVVGGYPDIAAALGGAPWSSSGKTAIVQRLLPHSNEVVTFAPPA